MTAVRKPSNSSLDQYLKSKKAPTRLTGPVERYLLTKPADTSRRTDVIHPSELCKSDFCARESYFVITQGKPEESNPNLRLQSIFDEGHAIHAKWQNWIWGMGNLYGKWKCKADDCHHIWWGLSPTVCEECGTGNIEYAEVSLFDEDLMIAGHSDGWVKGLGNDFMIEIKSIGAGTIRMEQPALFKDGADLGQAWRNIRRPFPTHMRQGLLYLELLRRMADNGVVKSAPEEIVFLYELKADQSYKEFVVKADPELVKDMLDTAYDIAYGVRTKTPPPCSNVIDGHCKKCAPFKEDQ